MKPLKRILITRTDRIGDVVLTLPLAGIIRKHYPDAEVFFMLRSYTEPLTYGNKEIAGVLNYDNYTEKTLSEKIKFLRSFRFDAVFVISPSLTLAAEMFLAGIRTRVGTGYRWYSFFFSRRVYEHRKDARFHEFEYNCRMLREAGIDHKYSPDDFNGLISVKPNSENIITQKLKEKGIKPDEKFVIIHPGSGGSSVDLPVESFIKLSGLLSVNFKVVITGSPSEYDLCQKLIVNQNVINCAGELDLPELIALISHAYAFISNSTGPIHIAAASGIRVAGFYPKIRDCSAERWGPYSSKSKVFRPEINCSGCDRKQCEALNCMSSIDMQKVSGYIENNA